MKHSISILRNFRGALGDEIIFSNRPCFSIFLSLIPVSFALCYVIVLPPLSCHLMSIKGDWITINMFLHSYDFWNSIFAIESTMHSLLYCWVNTILLEGPVGIWSCHILWKP